MVEDAELLAPDNDGPRAGIYPLTTARRQELAEEVASWTRLPNAIVPELRTVPGEG